MPNFRSVVPEAEEWIDDLKQRLGWQDRDRVYRALLATLHALRDSLPRDAVVYVGAQLPHLLRGLYYDGWHPGTHPACRSRSAFLERIHEGVHRDPGIDADAVAHAAFAMIAARFPPAELEAAKAATPAFLHSLWPD